ncbi:MAG: cytochrome P450, partial [Sphingomonadales bacterium]|nr:cytochrome P450 [Sphingomonadales bacterium]
MVVAKAPAPSDIDAASGAWPDPLNPAILADPYPFLARLRAEAPVWRDPRSGVVHVAGAAEVLAVNKQPRLFSSAMAHLLKSGGAGGIAPEEAAIMARGLPWIDTLITADPPAHSRYKRIALQAFTPVRVAAMAAQIAAISHALIDDFAGAGEVEFKSRFADLLPATVIAGMLGVPLADIAQFQGWLRSVVTRLSGAAPPAARIAAAHDEIALQHYLLAAIAERRRQPRADLISALVHATLSDGL